MKTNEYFRISIEFIFLFMGIIFISFIGEYFHNFFGDEYCILLNGDCKMGIHIIPTYHWGYRHFIWALLGVVLFVINIIRICNSIKW